MADIDERRSDRFNYMFNAGMWFRDLFNCDFRRTERCIPPYATQEGEISFCAHNTGVGWRNIIEKMHMTATLTKWDDEHGRHEIFAGGKKVALDTTQHSLALVAEDVNKGTVCKGCGEYYLVWHSMALSESRPCAVSNTSGAGITNGEERNRLDRRASSVCFRIQSEELP